MNEKSRTDTSTEQCQICRSGNSSVLYHIERQSCDHNDFLSLIVMQCKSCKSIFLQRNDDLQKFQGYYEKWWQKQWGPVYEALQEKLTEACMVKCRWLERLFDEKGKLLDIGCGEGTFLEVAQQRGWQVSGIEVTRSALELAGDRVGKDKVFEGFQSAGFDDNLFDLITLWDVIEHLPYPVDTLSKACQVLRPNGIITIVTPNVKSLIHRIAHCAYRLTFGLWKRPLAVIYIPGHLFYFSRSDLINVLHNAGFSKVNFLSDFELPGGLFDDLDAVFSANKGQWWARIPFSRWAIKAAIYLSRKLGQPYRLIAVAEKGSITKIVG